MNSKTKTQFIEYFIKGIKKTEQLKIGVEHERFLFEGKNKKRITYKKLKQLFENLKKKGWVSILEKKMSLGLKEENSKLLPSQVFNVSCPELPLKTFIKFVAKVQII